MYPKLPKFEHFICTSKNKHTEKNQLHVTGNSRNHPSKSTVSNCRMLDSSLTLLWKP